MSFTSLRRSGNVVLLELFTENAAQKAAHETWSCLNYSRKTPLRTPLTKRGLAQTVHGKRHSKRRSQNVVLLELFTENAAHKTWSCSNCSGKMPLKARTAHGKRRSRNVVLLDLFMVNDALELRHCNNCSCGLAQTVHEKHRSRIVVLLLSYYGSPVK